MNTQAVFVCLHFNSLSYRCILFAYHLWTVRHEISWLCYILSTVLFYFSFSQPVAVTGRRHLLHRPVDCAVLFYFICSTRGWHRPEAPPPQSPGWLYCFIFFSCRTRRRWLEAPPPQSSGWRFFYFCRTRRRWPEAPPPQSSGWHPFCLCPYFHLFICFFAWSISGGPLVTRSMQIIHYLK